MKSSGVYSLGTYGLRAYRLAQRSLDHAFHTSHGLQTLHALHSLHTLRTLHASHTLHALHTFNILHASHTLHTLHRFHTSHTFHALHTSHTLHALHSIELHASHACLNASMHTYKGHTCLHMHIHIHTYVSRTDYRHDMHTHVHNIHSIGMICCALDTRHQ